MKKYNSISIKLEMKKIVSEVHEFKKTLKED